MLADLIDLHGARYAGSKWKPYPRPFVTQPRAQMGNAAGQTPEQVKERLRLARMGQAERLET